MNRVCSNNKNLCCDGIFLLETVSESSEIGVTMLIITVIYCAEAEERRKLVAEEPAEERADDHKDGKREFLSIYQGRNRVLPID